MLLILQRNGRRSNLWRQVLLGRQKGMGCEAPTVPAAVSSVCDDVRSHRKEVNRFKPLVL